MSTGINDPARCPYCGLFHTTVCPTIEAIEYHPNGSIKRVEFKTAAEPKAYDDLRDALTHKSVDMVSRRIRD